MKIIDDLLGSKEKEDEYEIKIVAKEGCGACKNLLNYINNPDVQDILERENVKKIHVKDLSDEEGRKIANEDVVNKVKEDRNLPPFDMSPTVVIEKNGEPIDAEIGWRGYYTKRKIAKNIDADENMIDKIYHVKRKTEDTIDSLKKGVGMK